MLLLLCCYVMIATDLLLYLHLLLPFQVLLLFIGPALILVRLQHL